MQNNFQSVSNFSIDTSVKGMCFEIGHRIIEAQGTALIGISPGNGYFNRKNIHDLLVYSSTLFSKIVIVIPDKPAEHTYKALGYANEKAIQEAKSQRNKLVNRCKDAIKTILEKNSGYDIKILTWDEIECNPNYLEQLDDMYNLYRSNKSFNNDVRNNAYQIVKNAPNAQDNIESNIDEASCYVLKELAFVRASLKIIDVHEITAVYHNNWQICVDFISGKYDGIANCNFGFSIIHKQV